MILVIRHAQKGSDGNLTEEGRKQARSLYQSVKRIGYEAAIVAPNARSRQTAIAMGLKVIRQEPRLAIPKEYEEYLNGPVIERMLSQEGQPWEKSYTRAVLEDPLYPSLFKDWGRKLAEWLLYFRQIQYAEAQDRYDLGIPGDPWIPGKVVMIGSSPLVELGYLSIMRSDNWQDFPRCRELSGFIIDGGCRLFTPPK